MSTLKELDTETLAASLKEWGAPPYHLRHVFEWLYHRGVADGEAMTNLPKALREQIRMRFRFLGLTVVSTLRSQDGTVKLLLSLRDRAVVEAVLIPAAERTTACISSQVGCRFGCSFCASGAGGFKRNLSSAEMCEELFHLKRLAPHRRLSHVVFMGTGEPLDNYDHVMQAIRLINAEYGFGIGARRITISTSGVIPGIRRLATEGMQVELSVSLHAADDRLRSRLMPINRKYPLKDLMRAVASYIKKTDRQVTFEYVLIKGVNSDLHNARKLATMLQGLNAKVNLIACNPVGEDRARGVETFEMLLFKTHLEKSGIPATIRKSRGEDIQAACGQLRLQYDKR